jgi:hypothetical protein
MSKHRWKMENLECFAASKAGKANPDLVLAYIAEHREEIARRKRDLLCCVGVKKRNVAKKLLAKLRKKKS